MSIAEQDKVDLICILPGSPRVVLVAYDSFELGDSRLREEWLQNKLVAYLRFTISGQCYRLYPQFQGRDTCILVVCREQPTDRMIHIKGIRDQLHPEIFISVEFMTDPEFRRSLPQNTSH